MAATGQVSAARSISTSTSFAGYTVAPSNGLSSVDQCQLNGVYLGFWSPTEYNEVDGSGVTLIATGTLKSNSEIFTLTFKRAS
jgi:hypothetical protein